MTFIGLANLQPPTYDYTGYIYPDWAIAIGWTVAALSFLPFPITFVFMILKSIIVDKSLIKCFKPSPEWLPNKEDLVLEYRARWYPETFPSQAYVRSVPVRPKAYLPPNYFIEHSTQLWDGEIFLVVDIIVVLDLIPTSSKSLNEFNFDFTMVSIFLFCLGPHQRGWLIYFCHVR